MTTNTSLAPTLTETKEALRDWFTPVDRVILIYLSFIPLITVLFARPLQNYASIFINNAAVTVLVLAIVRYLPYGRDRLTDFLRGAYPALLFGYFYNQTGQLMHIAHPEFFDAWFTAWERSLFGVNATLWLDQHALSSAPAVWLTELLSLTYFSYYLMFPAVIVLFFAARRDRLLNEVLTASAITFFISYQLFWLFPLEGPRWHFAGDYQQTLNGPFFRELVNFVIAKGAVHGGCMPSTHTGVALVVLLYLYREYRTWFWIFLPFVIGIAVGAVYGRFHYPTDIVVGALIAVICTLWTMKRYPRWVGERPEDEHQRNAPGR
ncbi:MAG TPA: phosphatase PAP2 family protein [candidate division Zixibacteria bacterium]|nr:phosphatase PAP2 family protein [candidate division Zixibacteria bacterium]